MIDITIQLEYEKEMSMQDVKKFCSVLTGVKFGRHPILHSSVECKDGEYFLTIRTMSGFRVAEKVKVVYFTTFGDEVCPNKSKVVSVKKIKYNDTLKLYLRSRDE